MADANDPAPPPDEEEDQLDDQGDEDPEATDPDEDAVDEPDEPVEDAVSAPPGVSPDRFARLLAREREGGDADDATEATDRAATEPIAQPPPATAPAARIQVPPVTIPTTQPQPAATRIPVPPITRMPTSSPSAPAAPTAGASAPSTGGRVVRLGPQRVETSATTPTATPQATSDEAPMTILSQSRPIQARGQIVRSERTIRSSAANRVIRRN